MQSAFSRRIFLFFFLTLTTRMVHTVLAKNEEQKNPIGALIFKPKISVSEKYNDNIYTRPSHRKSDYITILNPSIVIEKTGTPHKFSLITGLAKTWYAQHPQDNILDFNIDSKGRYVLDPDAFLDVSGGYAFLHKPRGDNQIDRYDVASEPIPYDLYNLNTSFYRRSGKISVQPRFRVLTYHFQTIKKINGSLMKDSRNNRAEYIFGGDLRFRVSDSLIFIVDAESNIRKDRHERPEMRDGYGGQSLLGVHYQPNVRMLAKLSGGYMYQTWDKKNIYKNVGAWNAAADLDIKFRKTGILKCSMRRSIDAVTDKGASSAIKTDLKASISHGLYQNLLGTLSGRYVNSMFQGGRGATGHIHPRKDNTYEKEFSLTYDTDYDIRLSCSYACIENKSNSHISSYKKNVAAAHVFVSF